MVAPTITVQPMSMTVAVGSDVTFSVTATSEDNALTYQWYLNNMIIVSATEPSLSLAGVRDVMDEGDYSVIVTNSILSTTSMDATLTVSKWVNCHKRSLLSRSRSLHFVILIKTLLYSL